MYRRSIFLVVVASLLVLAGCGNTTLTSLQITPSAAAIATGQTAQFTAIGTYAHGSAGSGHPSSSKDVTSEVTWTSSVPSVATINSSGTATAVADGSTQITASLSGIVSTVTLQVGSGTSGTTNGLTALTIIPGTQTLTTPGETSQFIAIGTFSATPTTQDMTSRVIWFSSDVAVATINAAGLATAGTVTTSASTTITAMATNADGSVITGSATLSTQSSGGGGQLPSLAVYAVGPGSGTITSVPTGINCTSGSSSGCTAFFPQGVTITLTATPDPASKVLGFSSNCTPSTPPLNDPPGTPESCQVTPTIGTVGAGGNAAVGVIFDIPTP